MRAFKKWLEQKGQADKKTSEGCFKDDKHDKGIRQLEAYKISRHKQTE